MIQHIKKELFSPDLDISHLSPFLIHPRFSAKAWMMLRLCFIPACKKEAFCLT